MSAHASHFLNYNQANGGADAKDINLDFLKQALLSAKNAKKHFDGLIADSQPDKSVPTICQYAKVPDLVDAAQGPTPAPPPARPREEDPAPPGDNPRNPKKPKRRVLQPGVASARPTDNLGMFLPSNPGDIIVLPPSAGVCSGFTSRGQSCDHRGRECSKGLHAFSAKHIVNARGMEAITAIGDDFLRTGKGRFIKKHFKGVELPRKYLKLLVDQDAAPSA